MIVVFVILTMFVITLFVALYQVATAMVARSFRIDVEEVAIGMGPTICKLHLRSCLLSFRVIPLGGFTKLKGFNEFDAKADSTQTGMYDVAPLMARLQTALAGPVLLVIIGTILCGIAVWAKHPQLVDNSYFNGGREIPETGLAIATNQSAWRGQLQLTYDVGVDYLWKLCTFQSLGGRGGFVALLITTGRTGSFDFISWLTLIGVVAALLGAMNLLPIPPMSGFQAIDMVLANVTLRSGLPFWHHLLVIAGMLVLIIWFVRTVWLDIQWLF